MRSSLLRSTLKSKLRELRIGRVRGYGTVVEIGGRVVDGCDDHIIGPGNVLADIRYQSMPSRASIDILVIHERTRPLLFSTQMAFFLWSMRKGPARVVVIVDGGVCRNPGPSFRGTEGLDGTGRMSEGMVSPGRTIVSAMETSHKWE